MKRILKSIGALLGLGLVFGVGFLRLPYYAVGPGPAREVVPLIRVGGDRQTFPPSGKLIMTTVSFYPVTALQALQAWIDPNKTIVADEVLYPPGVDHATEARRARSQMDQSKIDAAIVVLAELEGYPKTHGTGALIEQTFPGCPADGELFAGDLILAIGGEPVDSLQEASHLIGEAPTGEPLDFRVRAAGETHDVEVAKRRCAGSGDPLVGIAPIANFPFPVEISSGNVGGPSAGLMFSLGLYDLLTPGELTSGRTIAGTGTIDRDGAVGPIGGISDKVVAAERVGASVFLVPKENMAELKGVDTGAMRLIEVATFDDALAALRRLAS
ncbi:MAG: S16 family serine protease [Actinomycetota bacterium]